MNNADVLWVGVSFDPDDNPRTAGDTLDRAHMAVVRATEGPKVSDTREQTNFTNGATFIIYAGDPSKGRIIDLYDARGFRIGFGIKVKDEDEGRKLVHKVRPWLHSLGITLPVSVWAWSPSSVPSRTLRRVLARGANVRRGANEGGEQW